MGAIAPGELGRAEEWVVGFAGQEFGEGAEIVFGGGFERLPERLGTPGLFCGEMGKGHGNPP
jgi:hypothetical protein